MTKTVLVTGAGGGIGRSIAWQLARDGYSLVLLTGSAASADALRRASPVCSAEVVPFDLADDDEMEGH